MPTAARQVELGGSVSAAATALAAWATYLASVPVPDQARDTFGDEARAHAYGATADPAAFLEFGRVVPRAVATHPAFRREFVRRMHLLREEGPLAAAAQQ
jgi:hypothetical protein